MRLICLCEFQDFQFYFHDSFQTVCSSVCIGFDMKVQGDFCIGVCRVLVRRSSSSNKTGQWGVGNIMMIHLACYTRNEEREKCLIVVVMSLFVIFSLPFSASGSKHWKKDFQRRYIFIMATCMSYVIFSESLGRRVIFQWNLWSLNHRFWWDIILLGPLRSLELGLD